MWPNANAHFVAFQAQLVGLIQTGGFAGFQPQTNQRQSQPCLVPSTFEIGFQKQVNDLQLRHVDYSSFINLKYLTIYCNIISCLFW